MDERSFPGHAAVVIDGIDLTYFKNDTLRAMVEEVKKISLALPVQRTDIDELVEGVLPLVLADPNFQGLVAARIRQYARFLLIKGFLDGHNAYPDAVKDVVEQR